MESSFEVAYSYGLDPSSRGDGSKNPQQVAFFLSIPESSKNVGTHSTSDQGEFLSGFCATGMVGVHLARIEQRAPSLPEVR